MTSFRTTTALLASLALALPTTAPLSAQEAGDEDPRCETLRAQAANGEAGAALEQAIADICGDTEGEAAAEGEAAPATTTEDADVSETEAGAAGGADADTQQASPAEEAIAEDAAPAEGAEPAPSVEPADPAATDTGSQTETEADPDGKPGTTSGVAEDQDGADMSEDMPGEAVEPITGDDADNEVEATTTADVDASTDASDAEVDATTETGIDTPAPEEQVEDPADPATPNATDPATDTTMTDTEASGDTEVDTEVETTSEQPEATDQVQELERALGEAADDAGTAAESAAGAAAGAILGTEDGDDTDGTEQATEDQPAAPAAAAADDAEATEVETEVVTEENSRSSDEDFDTEFSSEESPEATAEAEARAENDDDDEGGLSTLEKALIAGAGVVAVGSLLRGNREVVTKSDDRVVVQRQDGTYEVIKDDNALLRQPGNEVQTETFDDGSTRTTVLRPDGSRIVTIRDAELRVVRRVRVTPEGEQYTLIDDTETFEPVDVSTLQPAQQQATTLNTQDATEESLRQALQGQADYGRSFSLSQVRNISEVRSLVPAIDLNNITFETGSAAIQPDQARDLTQLGRTLTDLIDENPSEVFLIEGHTDAVGGASYNLALSDRRAESVALALSEYFDVPTENLVVQGYGEQYLKVQTEAAERENRRATVRRITPLLRTAASQN
ncbi:OmpA family protein [Mesobaculum littorinae]|uniref:OmpA family protein n=1 Tax=Mesobaculum littorinae TaxID=2486419 RepID=A0A438AJS8_9RHOB|nr:OmpA family protein [Mesobaculum littorinae]RVV98857.1 OmpA family protein [Mesobaculum littorinae]